MTDDSTKAEDGGRRRGRTRISSKKIEPHIVAWGKKFLLGGKSPKNAVALFGAVGFGQEKPVRLLFLQKLFSKFQSKM